MFLGHRWETWRFERLEGRWDQLEAHREYMAWLGRELRFQTLEDWYNLKWADLRKHGNAADLAPLYASSIRKLVATVFPDHAWQPWRFTHARDDFWEEDSGRKDYMAWLAQTLGFTNMDGWYRVRCEDFTRNYGGPLIRRFNDSPIATVMGVFQAHAWQPWRFDSISYQHWRSPQLQRDYMEWLGDQLGFTNMDAWYRLTPRALRRSAGGTLLDTQHKGSVPSLVRAVFPEHSWDDFKFRSISRGG